MSMPMRRATASRRCSRSVSKRTSAVGLAAQPGVVCDFLLELSGRPAGMPEQHQMLVGFFAGGQRLEYIA